MAGTSSTRTSRIIKAPIDTVDRAFTNPLALEAHRRGQWTANIGKCSSDVWLGELRRNGVRFRHRGSPGRQIRQSRGCQHARCHHVTRLVVGSDPGCWADRRLPPECPGCPCDCWCCRNLLSHTNNFAVSLLLMVALIRQFSEGDWMEAILTTPVARGVVLAVAVFGRSMLPDKSGLHR